nr:cell division protein FtsZ [Baekduia sp.]
MREGPLAALFRRTDEDEQTPEAAAEANAPEAPAQQPAREAPRAEAPAAPQAQAPEPARQAPVPEVPPATPAAARRREIDPLLERGPQEPPAHPRETGYPHPSLGAPPEGEAPRAEAPRAPSAQERLRNAFSSEIPDDMLAPPTPEREQVRAATPPPEPAPAHDAYARVEPPSPWGQPVVGQPIIRVIGVGGAGVNAINRMVEAEVQGVEFLAINTDLQSLQQSTADLTLHIGPQITRGLGAGSDPELGRQAAMEEYDRIKSLLKGSDMVFIAAGAGGGTGTGAAPIVARIAREIGALTVGIVTKPFGFEGSRRAQAGNTGIEALHAEVDTLIVVPNNRLLSVLDKHTSMVDAFRVADDVLRQGVQGVSDLVTLPGIINLDFADVRTIMSEAGAALLGIGMGVGDKRALEAAEQAVSSPLLETSMDGARSILLSITGGRDLSLWEVNEAAKAVAAAAHPDANIIFGAMVDEKLEDQVWVTVVATRYGDKPKRRPEPRMEEPTGEPRVERRTPARVGGPEREREPIAARRGGVVSDLDVPEFLPRR